MFGLSLISTKKLNHLYTEVSKLAIENVNLNKEVAKRDAIIDNANAEIETTKHLAVCVAGECDRLDSENRYLKRIIKQQTRSTKKRKKK